MININLFLLINIQGAKKSVMAHDIGFNYMINECNFCSSSISIWLLEILQRYLF